MQIFLSPLKSSPSDDDVDDDDDGGDDVTADRLMLSSTLVVGLAFEDTLLDS